MAQKNSDLRKIEEFIEIMKANDLVELEIKHGDDKIFLKRCEPMTASVNNAPIINQRASNLPANSGVAEPSVNEAPLPDAKQGIGLVEIKSPIVGTFYATPSPDAEHYVEVGSTVEPQTVVCIVEAMKVMNEIKAEVSGAIVEVLVTNGQAVEYGQVLFKVKPD